MAGARSRRRPREGRLRLGTHDFAARRTAERGWPDQAGRDADSRHAAPPADMTALHPAAGIPHGCALRRLPLRGRTGRVPSSAMWESVRCSAGWGIAAGALLALAGCDLGPATTVRRWRSPRPIAPAPPPRQPRGHPRIGGAVRLAGTRRADRRGPSGKLRPAGGHRPRAAGRRPGAHRRRRIAAQPHRHRQRKLGAGEPVQCRPRRPQPRRQRRPARLRDRHQRRLRSGLLGQDRRLAPGCAWRAPCSAGSTSRPWH